MIVGTRVVYPEEVRARDADILQISVYRGMQDNLELMRKCVSSCREIAAPYVIHPVRYSLLEKDTFADLREMAELADLALILHDERASGGGRLDEKSQSAFRAALEKLQLLTHVSIENAAHTGDVQWFWDAFAGSVTLDIGHIESFGEDSEEYVKSLNPEIIEKIRFVHMHRNNGLRGGITDHWPLTPDCREVRALKELLNRKSDVSVILELNEIGKIDDNLKLLRSIRDALV